ncbi:Fic family protein [Ligilactobacillus equi]|uniref:Fic family protein n=1 Tax=Ligilactobacillus equi TaxID=137357 RepID=UPI002ED59C9A
MNLVNLVYTNSRFEGLTTTIPQTRTIIDGLGVDGVSVDDINVIVQLKRGWQYIINEDSPVSLKIEQNINKIVAHDDSLDPGNFRNGSGFVATMAGDFIPPDVDELKERNFLQELLSDNTKSVTEKAIELMYHNMRNQILWDGNKRTATLIANKYMIDHGAGLINIPVDKWSVWNQLISEYYHSNDMDELKKWTYDVGIHGTKIDKKRG